MLHNILRQRSVYPPGTYTVDADALDGIGDAVGAGEAEDACFMEGSGRGLGRMEKIGNEEWDMEKC